MDRQLTELYTTISTYSEIKQFSGKNINRNTENAPLSKEEIERQIRLKHADLKDTFNKL